WQATVWGTPAAMAFVLLLTCFGVGATGVLVAVFWATFALLVAVAMVSLQVNGARLRTATAVCLVAAVAVHAFTNAGDVASPAAVGMRAGLIAAAARLGYDAAPRRLPVPAAEVARAAR